ncbi:DUF6269 family protein [Streptomyces sp. NPDC058382]|uniref:DUF6269 family protein n=1 Tax=unclassified Streptomyces TaxID=2593676 RepID=UPI00362E5E6C
MFDAATGTPRVQHPLEVLTELEQQENLSQELLLRDSSTPWPELMADYLDALSVLATQGHPTGTAIYGLDEGHAGGCG